jgi:Na+-exporting ATPase
MIHAIECKHFTLSIFQIDLLDNKVLLWCAGLLLLSTVRLSPRSADTFADHQFPVVHIPVINNKVFLVNGLGWEWGIVFGMILVYLVSTELWKWGKRVYFRRKAAKQPGNSHPGDKTLRMEPTVAPKV